jgi:hypothetical protein
LSWGFLFGGKICWGGFLFIDIPKAEKIVAEKAAHLLFIKIYVIILYIRKNQQLTKLLFFVIIIMEKYIV